MTAADVTEAITRKLYQEAVKEYERKFSVERLQERKKAQLKEKIIRHQPRFPNLTTLCSKCLGEKGPHGCQSHHSSYVNTETEI